MNRRWTVLAAACAAAVGMIVVAVWAAEKEAQEEEDEQQISIDQVPPKARDALTKLAAGAALTEVEQEQERGAVFFEAEWLVNGKEHEAKVTADGNLVETEEQIDAANVPPAVAAVAAKKFAGAEGLQFVKKVIVVYEIKAKKGGKTRELELTAAGTKAGEDDDRDDQDRGREGHKERPGDKAKNK